LQPEKLAEKSRERVAIEVLVELQLEGCLVAIRLIKIIRKIHV
jgi:hypothetical protein